MCGFGDNARILYTMRQLRTKMQETEEGQEKLKKYDVEGPIIAQKLAEESEPLLFGYKIISEYLIPTAGEVQKAEDASLIRTANEAEYNNAIKKQNMHLMAAENRYCEMIDHLKNRYGIKEDSTQYEYDSSVLPIQMGHGTARVHKVSVNRR